MRSMVSMTTWMLLDRLADAGRDRAGGWSRCSWGTRRVLPQRGLGGSEVVVAAVLGVNDDRDGWLMVNG